jgi:chloramphenicol-sensitive protein RarD
VAYTIWGIFPLYFHHLTPATSLEILIHRVLWSFVAVGLVQRYRRQPSGIALLRADPARALRIALAALLLTSNWLVYLWAVTSDKVVDAALGYFINPLLSVVLGVVVLHEHLRRVQKIAVGLGAAAVIVLSVGYGKVPWVALALATTFAAYGYLKKTIRLAGGVASLAAESTVLVPVALAAVVVVALTGRWSSVSFGHHGSGNAGMLLLAGPVTALPLALFGVAAQRIPLTVVGLLQYLTPVGQFLIGVLVFHEGVPPARLAGFMLVWAALVVLATDAVRGYRRHRADRPPVDGTDTGDALDAHQAAELA